MLEYVTCSEPNYGVPYKFYLGDGDCKGFETVCTEQPYGPDYEIQKNGVRWSCAEADGHTASHIQTKKTVKKFCLTIKQLEAGAV